MLTPPPTAAETDNKTWQPRATLPATFLAPRPLPARLPQPLGTRPIVPLLPSPCFPGLDGAEAAGGGEAVPLKETEGSQDSAGREGGSDRHPAPPGLPQLLMGDGPALHSRTATLSGRKPKRRQGDKAQAHQAPGVTTAVFLGPTPPPPEAPPFTRRPQGAELEGAGTPCDPQ